MYKGLKIKLYPNAKQKEMLDNHFNAYRYCYNLCLEYKIMMWRDYKINKSGYEMQSELFEIRKSTDWLLKCKAECIRDAALNIDKSFKNFFKGSGYPRYKSKKDEQSFSAYQAIKINSDKLYFYKNLIRFRTSDLYLNLLKNNKIKQVTFRKDKCGDYWATCLIEDKNQYYLSKNNNVIGIDLGIKDLIITSEKDKFSNNKYLINSQHKLKNLQRKFSKTKKHGKNREKLRIRIAKLYRKATRQKEHYYHQITNKLIRENQTIVLETLKIKNMMKNHKLARNISDASWGLIINMLEYKCSWYGRNLIKINQWYPSSKICSCCGNIKEDLSLNDRVYNCSKCDLSIDRDINAAINIKNKGTKMPGLSVEEMKVTSPIEAEIKKLDL